MTAEEIAEVEKLVNEKIQEALPVTTQVMDIEEAKKSGAMALFDEKYSEKVRVVSMPCMDIFEEQSEEYKAKVLPKNVRKRVAVEALSGFGWDRYVGLDGDIIGMNRFGASAPYSKLFPYFGFTVENVVARVKAL